MAQGYEDRQNSTSEERANIIAVWKGAHVELQRNGKKYNKASAPASDQYSAQGDLPTGFEKTRHLSWDERKKLAEEKQRRKKDPKGGPSPVKEEKAKAKCRFCSFDHPDDIEHTFTFPAPADADTDLQDYEIAIQRSVEATSTGDPEEDRMIARALRASMAELQSAQHSGTPESAYERAVAASVAEANRARAELKAEDTEKHAPSATVEDDDQELSRALKESIALHQSQQNLSKPQQHSAAPNLPPRTTSTNARTTTTTSDSDTEEDEDFKRALEESKRQLASHSHGGSNTGATSSVSNVPSAAGVHNDNDELARALTESKQSHESEAAKQKTEEEIVLEYVKKQSLLEEEHRRRRMGEE